MEKLFNQVYKGKKVLITGHTGFKGSWITLWLKLLGAEVIGYSLPPPTKPSLFETFNLEKEIKHVIGDIRDEDKLLKTFKTYKPDIVIHMAAQPLVRYSYLNPKETYETNVIGTLNLFECVRKTESIRVVINVTSDKCYENKEWVYGYKEDDPMGGYDPYSSSKGCAEILTTAYKNSFFNPKDYGKAHNISLVSVRAGNVIGGGDWAEDRLIPDCIRFLVKGKTIIIRNPKAIRPWQYVLEPLSGYLWLGAMVWQSPTEYTGAWNFGPNDEDILTVEELVNQVLELWGKGSYDVKSSGGLHEAKLLKLDISKARFFLKWKPTYNIKNAIEETISWYKTFYLQKEKDILHFSINQIQNYVNAAKLKDIQWAKED